jgi:DNA invertase Pin-like site-specific DNA recombinase
MKRNKSQEMRDMFDQGLSETEIAKIMGVRYQFVYNVISWYKKTNPNKIQFIRKDV